METAVAGHRAGGSAKWGVVGRAKFQIVPDVLLMKQQELGLDTTDMVVLLNITSFWWFKNAPPFPRSGIIAKRMGVTQRTVQRSMKKLEKKGYVRRGDYNDGKGNTFPAVYCEGLVERLEKLANSDVTLSAISSPSVMSKDVAEGDEIPF